MAKKDTLEEVAKTSIKLMLEEPFYGHFFTGLLKDVSDKTDTMATRFANNQMIKLIVNDTYWNTVLSGAEKTVTDNLRYGAIKHQILHIIFKHLLRVSEFGNKTLFNIAADLTVNQYIRQEQLTEDAIRLENFPEFEMERNKGLDYYYRRLSEGLDGLMDKLGEEFEDDEDLLEHIQSGDPRLNASEQRLKELLEDENADLQQHEHWEEFERLSAAEKKIMDTFINDAITQSVNRVKHKMHGTLPGGLQQYIDLLIESLKPTLNWRRVLRLFTASSSRTRLKNTIRRPSKRYGTTPGIKIQRKQKILVAVDTSGSVNEDELKEFFSEIYHIWKQGAEIYVVECDVEIHNQYLYKGIPPTVVSGRGGTDFNAPIRFANEEYLPDAIIYFTDGYASVPEVKSRKPLLWLITSNGASDEDFAKFPGRSVQMNAN